MKMNYECDGQMNIMDFILQQECPIYERLPVGTLIGRVVLGEVEKAIITKVEGNERCFFYRTDQGVAFNAQEAETDMEKLQSIADKNRVEHKTIEHYPLYNRVTVSYPPRWEGGHTLYGQVGIFEGMLYWKDDCTYEFLIPYENEKKLQKAYKEKLEQITGKAGFDDRKAKELTMLEYQLPMTRLYWSHQGFYASARYVKTNG